MNLIELWMEAITYVIVSPPYIQVVIKFLVPDVYNELAGAFPVIPAIGWGDFNPCIISQFLIGYWLISSAGEVEEFSLANLLLHCQVTICLQADQI